MLALAVGDVAERAAMRFLWMATVAADGFEFFGHGEISSWAMGVLQKSQRSRSTPYCRK